MEWISRKSILIVGLGLMGGSYARALKRLGYHVSAIDTDSESVTWAEAQGIVDRGYDRVEESVVRGADAVIFALYPRVFLEWIREWQHLFKPGLMITDVTGVKACVVYDVQALLREDVEYIAAHPMAGREVYGVKNSDDRIFRDANYIVVPTEKNTPEGIETCRELGRELGFARISTLSPAEHDDMIAFLSQLTHCIAVSLMCCKDDENLVAYTGDSFRDLTRIARINEEMWSELFLMNRKTLLSEMEGFRASFDELYEALKAGDREKMKELMRISTARRAKFDRK